MNVSGDKELIAALQLLARGVPGPMIDKAAAAAAQPMLNSATEVARTHRQKGRRPKGGHLDEGIAFRKAGSRGRVRTYLIGGVNRARRLMHLLEFGTAPHFQPRRFGGIFHPGARKFPFMRPALDQHGGEVPQLFGRAIWNDIRLLIAALPKRR